MTTRQNIASGGVQGTTVSPANSGGTSGDAFDTVATTGSQTLTYDNAHTRASKPFSFKVTSIGTSGVAYATWAAFNTTQWRARIYVYLTALPPVEQYLMWIGNGSNAQATVGLLTSGKLVQRGNGIAGTPAGGTGTPNSGTAVIPLNQWVRIEFSGTVGAAGSGVLRSSMYTASAGESTTAADSLYTTTNDTSGGNFTVARIGNVSTGTSTTTYWVDAPAYGDDSQTFFGPQSAAANIPPNISAGSTVNMNTGTSTTVTFTATSSTSTISSFQTPSITSSQTTAPTIGATNTTGIGTSSASVTYTINGLGSGETLISTNAVDATTAVSVTPATQRIVYSVINPLVRSLTMTGVTMTYPTTGTAKDAMNAWILNPYNATTNPGGVQPPVFATAGPPAAGAVLTATYQPLDGTQPPTFGWYWSNSDGQTPITVYVDLKFNGTTRSTASLVLTSTTPTNVTKAASVSENTAIGADRSLPSVVSRFS